MLSGAIFWLICATVSFSCSVKEKRDACPCILEMDFSRVDRTAMKSVGLHVMASDGFVLSEKLSTDTLASEKVIRLPKTGICLNVCHGDEGMVEESGRMSIPLGKECPPVYSYTSVFDADCEYRHETVEMAKNHCCITVSVSDPENFGYDITIRGKVAGYGVDGRPEEGEFVVRKSIDKEGICQMSVPRQLDGSLVLEVEGDVKVLKRFPLGEYVLETGYDWSERNLKDVRVGIDYSLTFLSLSVSGWENEYFFEVEM